jgi:GH15 family glucan-1,4-alpha-glucosidase
MAAGHHEEAMAWRKWLLRAVAGDPAKLQIMYGVAGERSLPELELPWLGGYEKSLPVRVGNAASRQLQLDVYGEVMWALHEARRLGLHRPQEAWDLELVLLGYLETGWRAPDEGIWEVRGPRRHFTYSKVMAWAAFDAAISDVERYRLPGPLDRWKALRDEIHAEVCEKGFDHERNTFTQYYGTKALDASLLLIPRVGFLPPTDKRVLGTIAAIEEDLLVDGFVRRYDADCARDVDGLAGKEGAFLACSFWLVGDLALVGRTEEAHALYEKLLGVRNDLGLFSEEYDPQTGRLLGNFPQAFSHLALVDSALCLSLTDKPEPLPADHPAHVSSFHRRRHHGASASPRLW